MAEISSIYDKGRQDPDPDGDGIHASPESGAAKVTPADNAQSRKAIKDAFARMKEIDARREQCNADTKSALDGLEVHGIKRSAAKAAYKRWIQDEDEREEHDASYLLCCEAMGVPYEQGSLDLGTETTH